MMQIKSATNLEQALSVMVKASGISSMDASGIMALAQTSSNSDDDDDDSDTGAPEAAVYENKSGGIVDTLNGLLEKATSQLDASTKAETTNKNNFDMLKQGLTDEIKFANKDLDESKKELAEAGEIKAGAEGDLAVTSEELKALAMAKKAVVENTQGATDQSYSFMQMSSSSDLKNTEAVQLIPQLGQEASRSCPCTACFPNLV